VVFFYENLSIKDTRRFKNSFIAPELGKKQNDGCQTSSYYQRISQEFTNAGLNNSITQI
jgi:hypothetical protein